MVKKKKCDPFNLEKIPWGETTPEFKKVLLRNRWNMQSLSDDGKRWITRRDGCFFLHKVYRMKAPPRVIIHVRGGVAYVHKKTKGVEVTIRDFDNEAHR